MVSIFSYSDYREFLNSWIKKNGLTRRGLQRQLALAAGVSSTLVSLILASKKHLSLEQASDIADFVGLTEKESDYFFLLVEFGRAGSYKLQNKLQKRIQDQQLQAQKITNRVTKDLILKDEEKAIYYSSWIFAGIRNLSATPGVLQNVRPDT
jgi:uncharacterized protein (TIGR02147 family)